MALVQQIIHAAPYPRTPLDINGFWLPLPPGAASMIAGPPLGADWGPEGPTQGTSRGKSVIWWNNKGLMRVEIAPEDEADFQPFLDGLKKALNVE